MTTEREFSDKCRREVAARRGERVESLTAKAARLEAEQPQPIVRATRYEVSLLPEDDINYPLYALAVEARGGDRWAVTRHRECLGTDGEWSWEPRPSERDGEWITAHRFDLDTALKLAREAAPHVRVNRWTAAEALRERQQKEATDV